MNKVSMKKIGLFLCTILVAFSCQDYNEDNFEGYEGFEKPKNVAKYETSLLEDADLKVLVDALKATKDEDLTAKANKLNSSKTFSEELSASELIPYFLSAKYYTADVQSSATVTYRYDAGRDEVVDAILGDVFTPSDNDFKKVWSEKSYVNAFTPEKSPEENLPGILASNFPDATKNSYKTVQYDYSAEEAEVDSKVDFFIDENFEERGLNNNDYFDFEGWTNVDLKGTRRWQAKEYSGNFYAQYSSNGSKSANDAWFITNQADLTNATDASFSFDITAGFYNADCLTILVSTNYDGKDIKAATWKDITSNFTLPTEPATGYGKLSSAGTMSMKEYNGKKLHIAFHYEGDDTSSPKRTTTFQIDNIKMSEETIGLTVKNEKRQYATYSSNGEKWSKAPSYIITLQPEDYDAMGLSKGTLAKADAPKYLPTYLSLNYPYAQEGNDKVIVYKTGNSSFYADRLTFNNGVWTVNSFVEVKTDQFVYAQLENKKAWIFDPTFIFTLEKADYQMLVDYAKDNLSKGNEGILDNRGNAEFYYGFNAYYPNVTYREKDRILDNTYPESPTEEEAIKFMNDRTIEGLTVLLTIKYPNATAITSGVEQFARIENVRIYSDPTPGAPQNNFWTYTFQCIGDKEWKFIKRVSVTTGAVEEVK